MNGIECELLKRSSFEVWVYFNFIFGLLIFESEGLFLKDSEVWVYDSSGRLMKSVMISNWRDYLELNFGGLLLGIYLMIFRLGFEFFIVCVVKD